MEPAQDVPLGWRTDLGVLILDGAVVEARTDHLVVRSPEDPDYYWGNFLVALTAAEDAERWEAAFCAAFPGAGHRSIGLPGLLADDSAWTSAGFVLDRNDVLVASEPPRSRPLPEGYAVRPLETDPDWLASTGLRQVGYPEQAAFEATRTPGRRSMTAAGHTRWFGAFAEDGALAAELGVVDLGDGAARYQSVLTHPDHRRRGLTGHLLGVAADWARARGCERWVIIADADGDAGRLYRAAGFEHTETLVQAFRGPDGG